MQRTKRIAKNPFGYSFDHYKVNPDDYREKLKTWIASNPKGWYANFKASNKEIIDLVNASYPNLDRRPFPEKLYWFANDLKEFPICRVCHEHPTRFLSFSEGYSNWCCNKCAQSDEETKCKVVQSKIEKFGVTNNSQTDEFKRMIKEKIANRTSEQKQRILNKFKATCKKNHGYEHHAKSEIVKEKIRASQIEHMAEIQSRSRERCFQLHGCYYTGQIKSKIEKTKETFDSKYGGHPFSMGSNGYRLIEEYKNISFDKLKSRRYILYETHTGLFYLYRKGETCIIPNNVKSKLQFDSSWEVFVYLYCRQNNITVIYHPKNRFKYDCDGKTHWYCPDFLIDGKLYEVKGDHFFRTNPVSGQEEMFMPYRHKHWTNDYYQKECQKANAKYHCMLDNDVVIIRYNEICHLHETLHK